MAGLGHGGYLLSCIRIFEDEAARSIMSAKRSRKREADKNARETKKAKLEEEAKVGEVAVSEEVEMLVDEEAPTVVVE